MKTGWSISALTGAVAVGMIMLPALAPGDSDNQDKELKPNGKGIGTLFNPGNGNGNAGPTKGKPSSNISYHGGPVMLGTNHVYYIWYGNWANNSAVQILTDFASNIGGSPYFNINTTYYDGSNLHVINSVTFGGATTDNYSLGATHLSLSDADIRTIVTNAISSGALPKDSSGAYFVLTSQDVAESSGFCTQYCGWHTYGTIAQYNIKYAFVGNAARCPSACAEQTTSPNENFGADAMASVIGHELEEMVTDPNLNAWYDSKGMENADKCAWTFGTTYTVNGALANMHLGSRDFLIQQNWLNIGNGSCAKSY